MAAGRLAEMLGAGVLDIDRFMRTVDLERAAKALQRGVSPEVMHLLERYAQGVNRYLALHQGRLPLDLDAAGHHPEPWTPRASLLVFCLLNFGLAANLQEEIAALALAQRVGTERLAWLLPVYPDEPLPFDETAKLAELTLQAPIPGLGELAATGQKIAATRLLGAAASNNWAVAPARSTAGKSLLANDTHLRWPCRPTGTMCTCARRSCRRRRRHRRPPGRGRRLQRLAGLGHDHGHGRQPGSVPGATGRGA